jgi:DNA-binding GntR family transcriptional regulator
LKPGQQLPRYERLATEYEVSVATLLNALPVLLREGRLVGRQGKGTYVAETPPTAL